MARTQLNLIYTDGYTDDDMWRLDERTIRVGRQGLAQARAALASSRRPVTERPRRRAA